MVKNQETVKKFRELLTKFYSTKDQNERAELQKKINSLDFEKIEEYNKTKKRSRK
jgi:hypothetical protein